MSLHDRVTNILSKAQDSLFGNPGSIKRNPNLRQEKRVVQGPSGPYLKTVYVKKDEPKTNVQESLFGPPATPPAKPTAPTKPAASASKPVQESLFGSPEPTPTPATKPAAKPKPEPAPEPAQPAGFAETVDAMRASKPAPGTLASRSDVLKAVHTLVGNEDHAVHAAAMNVDGAINTGRLDFWRLYGHKAEEVTDAIRAAASARVRGMDGVAEFVAKYVLQPETRATPAEPTPPAEPPAEEPAEPAAEEPAGEEVTSITFRGKPYRIMRTGDPQMPYKFITQRGKEYTILKLGENTYRGFREGQKRGLMPAMPSIVPDLENIVIMNGVMRIMRGDDYLHVAVEPDAVPPATAKVGDTVRSLLGGKTFRVDEVAVENGVTLYRERGGVFTTTIAAAYTKPEQAPAQEEATPAAQPAVEATSDEDAPEVIELDDIDRDLMDDGYLHGGDQREMNGATYELQGGAWHRVDATEAEPEDEPAEPEEAPAAEPATEEPATEEEPETEEPAGLTKEQALMRVHKLNDRAAMTAFVREHGDLDTARREFMQLVTTAAGGEPSENVTSTYQDRFDQLTRPAGWRFEGNARATLDARADLNDHTFESLHVYGSPLRPLGSWARIPEAVGITFSESGRTDTSAHSYVFSQEPLDPELLDSLELITVAEPTVEAGTPPMDAQALGRSYRIGETKTVNGRTYRLNENSRWERVDDDAPSEDDTAREDDMWSAAVDYSFGGSAIRAAEALDLHTTAGMDEWSRDLSARFEGDPQGRHEAWTRERDAQLKRLTREFLEQHVPGGTMLEGDDVPAAEAPTGAPAEYLEQARDAGRSHGKSYLESDRKHLYPRNPAADWALRRATLTGRPEEEHAEFVRAWLEGYDEARGDEYQHDEAEVAAFVQEMNDRAAMPGTLGKQPGDTYSIGGRAYRVSENYTWERDPDADTTPTTAPAEEPAEEPAEAEEPAGVPPVGVQPGWTPSLRRKYNTEALALLEDLRASGRKPTNAEKAVLARYSGEGGIGASLNEFYTPPALADAMWAALGKLGVSGDVLEPSAGTGVMQQFAPDSVRFTAVEMNGESADINAYVFDQHEVVNAPFERYVTAYNDGKRFDAVIGNPPFGPREHGTDMTDGAGITRAENYFTLRSLQLTKPGGVVALVVPHGILSNKGEQAREFRRQLLAYGDLLVAHGLPASAFKGAGTDAATTDVLIFRARGKEAGELLEGASDEARAAIGLVDEDFISGTYFDANPDNLHGEWDHSFRTTRTGDMSDDILDAIANTDFRNPDDARLALDDRSTVAMRLYEAGHLTEAEAASFSRPDEELKEGKTRFSPQTGRLQICINGRWHNVEKDTPSAWTRGTALSGMLEQHAEAVAQGDAERANALRPQLQKLLEQYQREHGNPHQDKALMRLAKESPQLNALLAAIREDGTLAGAYTNDAQQRGKFDPRDIGSVARYLRRTSHNHTVTPRTAFTLFQSEADESEESIARKLNNAGWYADPDGNYKPAAELFTGDGLALKRRLHAALEAADPDLSKQLKATLDKLEPLLVRPALEDIPVSVRSPWLPKKLVHAYLSENISRLSGHEWDYEVDAKGFISIIDKRIGYRRDDRDSKAAFAELNRVLTGKGIGNDEAMRERIDRLIGEEFKEWLDERGHRGSIEEAYAETAGVWLEGKYDDSPIDEKIEGWNPDFKLHPWQNEAANRALAQGGSIIALDVGLGKTLTAVGMVMHAKQSGQADRPMVAVPKSVVANWRKEWLEAAPDARLAIIGAKQRFNKDGTPALDDDGNEIWDEVKGATALDKQIAEARAGDYDAVLITHTTLGRIPQDPEAMLAMIEAEFDFQYDGFTRPDGMTNTMYDDYAGMKVQALIDAGELDLATVEQAAARVKEIDNELKDIRARERAHQYVDENDKTAKQRAKAEAQFYSRAARRLARKDINLSTRWESLGVDMLVVDEAHEFKGLWEPDMGRNNVRYLGAGNTSSRALDLYYKTKSLRQNNQGRGVHLLTATPIKNSPVELYNMLSFTNPEIFAGMGITNLNTFIDTFCDIQTMTIPNPDTGEDRVERYLAGMKNLNVLREASARWVNRRTAEQVGLPLPEKATEREIIAPDDEQRSVLKEFLDKPLLALREHMGFTDIPADVYERGGDVQDELMQKYQLALPHLLRRAELDLEMLYPDTHKGYVSPKVGRMLDDVSGMLERGESAVIFCDAKDMFSAAAIDEADDGDEDAPAPRKRATGRNPNGYSFHEKLANLISERTGIPRQEIGIANADVSPTADDRLNLSRDLEAGRIRVVIGNTGTMGQGMNLQKAPGGMSNLLHLDVPWNPAVLQQREGRAVRQGNKAERVNNRFYLGARGYDPFMVDTLRGKSNWYDEFWNGTDNTLSSNKSSSFNFSSEEWEAMAIDDDAEREKAFERIRATSEKAQEDLARSQAVSAIHNLQKLRATLKHHEERWGHADPKRMQERAGLERKVARELEAVRKRPGAEQYADLLDSPELDNALISQKSGHVFRPGDVFQHEGFAYRLEGVNARTGRLRAVSLNRDQEPQMNALDQPTVTELPLKTVARATLHAGYDDDAYFRRMQQSGRFMPAYSGSENRNNPMPRTEAQREHLINEVRRGAKEAAKPDSDENSVWAGQRERLLRSLFVRRGGQVQLVNNTDLRDDDDILMPFNERDVSDLTAYLNDESRRQTYITKVREANPWMKDYPDPEVERSLDSLKLKPGDEPNPYEFAAPASGSYGATPRLGRQGFHIEQQGGYNEPKKYVVKELPSTAAKAALALLNTLRVPRMPKRAITAPRTEA